MNAAFLKSAIPQPFRVLGRNLKPFSIGHETLLAASTPKNAYSNYSEEHSPGLEDFFKAVWLCGFEYSGAIRFLLSGQTFFGLWLWCVKKLLTLEDINSEKAKFESYISHYRTTPEFNKASVDKSASVAGVPFEVRMILFLCIELGKTELDAINTPYNQAVCYYLAHMESKGAIVVVDSLEELRVEGLAQQDDTIEKGRRMLA